MTQDHRHFLDSLAWVLGGLAVFGFWQGVALGITILAGLGSLSLVALRWHDRIKYGPNVVDE